MRTFTVAMERIGRNHDIPLLTVKTTAYSPADEIAAEVDYAASRHLVSRAYTVTVDLDAGTVSLDGGRFGRGTVTEVHDTQ